MFSGLAVFPARDADCAAAELLSLELTIPLLPVATQSGVCSDYPLLLEVTGRDLLLRQSGRGSAGPVAVNFGAPDMRYRRRGGQNELLGKAVGVGKKKPLRVLDATAGLGRDGFILADLDCEMTLCERHPVVAKMLSWGLSAASGDDDPWLRSVAARMSLQALDARSLEPDSVAALDVIYMDPMFPQRKKSASVKKEMLLFQTLLENSVDPDDAGELLLWALSQSVARVVVKRPLKAPVLAGRSPSHCISGKAVRFDVYVQRKLS